jgi:hypothetical protein
MTDDTAVHEDGFEYQGEFVRWHVSDIGKNLMLIDRITGMAMDEFFAVVEDPDQRGRGPILLTLIATSLRNHHPDWSVERIYRTVTNLSLSSDIELVDAETELPDVMLPPAGTVTAPPSDGDSSSSPSNGSSSSSTPPAGSPSETSSGIPV